MKKYFLQLSLILVLMLLQISCVMYAQEQSVISDSIYSNILNEERAIKIVLPDTYKPDSTDKYEVIYLTDGEWVENLFPFIYRFAKGENYVPPAIIVAIPNKYINEVNQRDRDYLPMHVSQPAISGGAPKYLSFIKNELIPYIDSKYPTNGTNSLYGHSFGGLFTTYALLTEPQLFEYYYATDPPFGFDNDYMIKMVEQKLADLPSDKVFWIAGTSQNHDVVRLDSLLQHIALEKLHWKMATYQNEKHNSVRLKAMYDGIKFAYAGYPDGPLNFHPMKGILLKDKPIWIWVDNYPDLRYTVDGTEPNRTSQKVGSNLYITGSAQLVIKSFSTSGKYDKTGKGNFELGEALPSIAKPGDINSGGLKYSYYEGNWDKLPDFENLKPVKTGIVDSVFNINKLPKKTDFACLFEGYFEVVKDGYYVFVLFSNDGSKMFLGDKLIIDNDGVRSTQSIKSFVLPLEKGFYPVRIEYFVKDEGSVFQLLYLEPESENAAPFPLKYQYYEN